MDNQSKVKPTEFTIKDDYGDEHSYYVVPHDAEDGWQILMRSIEIVGPSLFKMAGKADFGAVNFASAIPKMGEASEAFGDVLSNEVDLGGLGDGIAHLASELLRDKSIIGKLFEHTIRDGQHSLSDRATRSVVYAANYGEMVTAIGKVWWANFGPSLSRVLKSKSGLMNIAAAAQK